MNNDELQKAIDDITSGGVGAPVDPAPVSDGVTDENEQLANEFGAAAPAMPTMTAAEQVAAELGETPAPVEVSSEPVIPVMPVEPTMPMAETEPVAAPVAPEEPVAPVVEQPAEEPVEEPTAPEIPEEPVMDEPKMDEPALGGDVDLEEVKKNALKELYPLLKNMNINPEQAYDICKQVAEMGEKGAISEAFEAAKKISDDQTRANALFEIVEMIEK